MSLGFKRLKFVNSVSGSRCDHPPPGRRCVPEFELQPYRPRLEACWGQIYPCCRPTWQQEGL